MRSAWIIAKREMRAWFASPMAYVVLTAWLLWCGFLFYALAAFQTQSGPSGGSGTPLSAFFGGTVLFHLPLLIFVPLMTMRLVAEEKRSGTIEALMTVHITERSIIAGKYIAGLSFWVSLWLPTVLYVWIARHYGDVDLGATGAAYFGIFNIGVSNIAIGLFASSVARNQIVAAVISFLILGGFFLVGILGDFIFFDTTKEVLTYISVWSHMQDYAKGIIDTRYLVYDYSLAALMLFFATRSLEARRYA